MIKPLSIFDEEFFNKHGLFVLISSISIIVVVVFKDYLLFTKLSLFKDIGSDSININYPMHYHITEYLWKEGIPKWSFNLGMGQNLFPYSLSDPFSDIVSFAGKDNVAYLIAYMEVLKIYCSGIIYYYFLKEINVSEYSAVIGALFYAFSASVIGWLPFSTKAVYGALLFYAYEKMQKGDSWWLFPIVTALFAAFNPISLYLYAILLLIYITYRYYENNKCNIKGYISVLGRTAGYGLLGVAISSYLLFPSLLQMFYSPRVSGEASFFNKLMTMPVFGFERELHYITVILRLFSNELLGTGSYFRGWNNYLEAPLLYCGLLMLLIFTQLLVVQNRKSILLHLSLLVLLVLPVIFPFFRYTIWLFSGNYYREYAAFISFVIILFGAKSLDTIGRNNIKLSMLTLEVTLIVLLLTLYFPWYKEGLVNETVRFVSTILLILYGLTIYLWNINKYKKWIKAGILIIIVFELSYMSNITINNRPVITGEEQRQKIGYNDYTNEATAYLNTIDKGFFRVSKDYTSGLAINPSLNDAKIQHYYGTESYHQFNQINYVRFLHEMEILDSSNEARTRWILGLRTVPGLYSFASIKYVLTKSAKSYLLKLDYDQIAEFGDVKILNNHHSLPFGFTYDKWISLGEFKKLSKMGKIKSLYKAAVIEEDRNGELLNELPKMETDTGTDYKWNDFLSDVDDRKKESLQISEHGQNLIRGSIKLSSKKILFFTIPFDRGWEAEVDGKTVSTMMIDIGFTGLLIGEGYHTVELKYSPPYYKTGAIISIISIMIYAVLLIGWKRKPRVVVLGIYKNSQG